MSRLLGSTSFAVVLAVQVCCGAGGQVPGGEPPGAANAPIVRPAVDAVFDAFDAHPLVGIGEWHGLAQEMELYNALVRDARFAQNVGNVVVEFGGAAHQDVIDRYVNGEQVAYTDLRKVWMDAPGWGPAVTSLGYAHFFAQVRETNFALPPEQRIRVWLGEPSIDWAATQTLEQFNAVVRTRDRHAADVIIESVLAKGAKALVIYGGQHFRSVGEEEAALRAAWAAADPEAEPERFVSLQGYVEAEHPDAFFVVQTYIGFEDEVCTERFERAFDGWPMPALVTSATGSTLENEMRRCSVDRWTSLPSPRTMPQALQDLLLAQMSDILFNADATLFLGAAGSLTASPILPDIYLDLEYREEMSRRNEIVFGQPLPPVRMENIPVTPRGF